MKKQTGIFLLFLILINVLTAYVISLNMLDSHQFQKLNLSFTFIMIISFFTLILGVLIDLVITNLIIKITLKIFNYNINKLKLLYISTIYILILSLSNLAFNFYYLFNGINEIKDMQVSTYLNPFIYISSLFIVFILNKKHTIPMNVSVTTGIILIIYKFLSSFILTM